MNNHFCYPSFKKEFIILEENCAMWISAAQIEQATNFVNPLKNSKKGDFQNKK